MQTATTALNKFLPIAFLVGSVVLGGPAKLLGQLDASPLSRDLKNLWDGTWVGDHLSPQQKPSVQIEALNVALIDHRQQFSYRTAVEREWQLAEIRTSLAQPGIFIQTRYPALHDHISSLSETITEDYTKLHEELFDRDTEWERLRSDVFIDFEGNSARSGELLARAIQYILERNRTLPDLQIEKEVFSVIERRIQDYLFAFNNGTAANRRQIHAAWSHETIDLQSYEQWQLQGTTAEAYQNLRERYAETVTKLKADLEYAFNNPKFVTRRGISPAVGDILQLLSENYFEYETYSRWFGENEALMKEALVVADMRTRATPHEVVKLDPNSLEPTDLDEAIEQTEFVETITEKRKELLLKYLAIRDEVNGQIEEEIIQRKKLLSPEEEEVLWREYQKMKELTRSASSAPSTIVP